jgi:hypothetical protein
MASRGESTAHVQLKRLALAWAQANGLPLCATEVRVPKSGFRADVAASSRGPAPKTAIFECKQARSDLLKDAHAEAATRELLTTLTERRRTMESLFQTHRPDLRRCEALWPEYDTWDFGQLEHSGYQRLLVELDRVQRRVVRGTKFSKLFRYRAADFLYLVVEDGIFAEAEVPAGWGLLCRRGDELELRRRPADLSASDLQRSSLVEQIALAGTRAVNRAFGISFSPARWTSREMPKM